MEQTLTIIVAAFLSSIVSGLTGMGGGFVLLVFMSSMFTPAILIPLHGVIQLISNLARGGVYFRHIQWWTVSLFALGAMIGAFIGSFLLIEIPVNRFRLLLGGAILIMTWMPTIPGRLTGKMGFFSIGAASTFLSLFIGATGPLIAPFFLRSGLTKERLIGTKAGCQIPLHILKIAVYVGSGFLLNPWIPVFLGVIPSMVIGIKIGKILLGKVSEKRFTFLLKIVITLLAVKLLINALSFI